MKPAVAAALICALLTPSLAAAQPDVVWWKVREIPSGTRMTLTREGQPPYTTYFVSADDTGFKVLNVSDPEMPGAAARALRRLASERPEQLTTLTEGRTLWVDGEITLSASGLFAGNRKIAEYGRVIESVSRSDVQTGAVLLENVSVAHGMSRSTKWIIAAVAATPFLIYPIMCITSQRCD